MSRLDFVKIAAAEVGVKEVTPNNSPRILQYRDATTLGRKGLPDASWYWCSAFVCWCVASYIREYRAPIALFKSARADDWERWQEAEILKPGATLARAGDIVTFEFDGDATAEHVGIVEADQKTLGEPLKTIEGNTRPNTATRDSGLLLDGVYRMTRPVKLCRKYIRWL